MGNRAGSSPVIRIRRREAEHKRFKFRAVLRIGWGDSPVLILRTQSAKRRAMNREQQQKSFVDEVVLTALNKLFLDTYYINLRTDECQTVGTNCEEKFTEKQRGHTMRSWRIILKWLCIRMTVRWWSGWHHAATHSAILRRNCLPILLFTADSAEEGIYGIA